MGVTGSDEERVDHRKRRYGIKYPMPALVPSYLDNKVSKAVASAPPLDEIPLRVTTVPHAINSRPYDGRAACEGFTSCVPLCPIKARYEAVFHVEKALAAGDGARNGASAESGDAAPAGPTPALPGVGESCPKCGEADGGHLVAKRGRFGGFVGCDRYPDCDYIHRQGPPPPAPLAFEVACPKCGQGNLLTRRARRTGSLFWGCSRYPKCDFTTSREPLGAVHDADDGPVARQGDAAICLRCGAAIELPADGLEPGARVPGGPANPDALARPKRGGNRGARARAATATRAERTRPEPKATGARGGRGGGRRRRSSAA